MATGKSIRDGAIGAGGAVGVMAFFYQAPPWLVQWLERLGSELNVTGILLVVILLAMFLERLMDKNRANERENEIAKNMAAVAETAERHTNAIATNFIIIKDLKTDLNADFKNLSSRIDRFVDSEMRGDK